METLTQMPRSVAKRELVPEVMDDPSLEADRHHAALRGLARINAVSGSSRLLWPAVMQADQRKRAQGLAAGPLRVLDVACGGGDVAVSLLLSARRRHVAMSVTAIDMSETALRHATQRATAAGLSTRWGDHEAQVDLEVKVCDVLKQELPVADVAMCSLFLHHLTVEQAVVVLRKMSQSAETVLVNDLCRSAAGYAVAKVGTRILSRSDVVHVDGPRSVKAAWTPGELAALAERAGMRGAVIHRRFPWRMLLEWRRA